jgi:hypothetical protein
LRDDSSALVPQRTCLKLIVLILIIILIMIEEFYSYRGRRHRLRRDPLMLLNIVDSSEKLSNDFYSRQRLSIIKINCLIIIFIFNEDFL